MVPSLLGQGGEPNLSKRQISRPWRGETGNLSSNPAGGFSEIVMATVITLA